MDLPLNFNLESLNLDIETYSKDELLQILRIPNNYTKDDITKNKNSLQDKINKLSIDSTKKYTYLLFLDNAEKKLLNNFFNNNNSNDIKEPLNLITNTDLFKNEISNYNNNFIIENSSIRHNPLNNITVGQFNNNTRLSQVTIDSIFRPNYYNTESSNFTITLPEVINNVISMRLSSIIIPIDGIYNISKELGNNTFNISNDTITISDGIYRMIDTDASNSLLMNIRNQSNNINSITLDPISRRITIDASESPIIFASDNTQPLTLSLGWQLGFRAGKYELKNITSEAAVFNHITKRIYISINDYQNNAINKFTSAFSESLLPDNILAEINYSTEILKTMQTINDRTRIYDGPTQINKLSFTLYDEYGRIINLNNNDWSCVLTFEYYRAVQN